MLVLSDVSGPTIHTHVHTQSIRLFLFHLRSLGTTASNYSSSSSSSSSYGSNSSAFRSSRYLICVQKKRYFC